PVKWPVLRMEIMSAFTPPRCPWPRRPRQYLRTRRARSALVAFISLVSFISPGSGCTPIPFGTCVSLVAFIPFLPFKVKWFTPAIAPLRAIEIAGGLVEIHIPFVAEAGRRGAGAAEYHRTVFTGEADRTLLALFAPRSFRADGTVFAA